MESPDEILDLLSCLQHPKGEKTLLGAVLKRCVQYCLDHVRRKDLAVQNQLLSYIRYSLASDAAQSSREDPIQELTSITEQNLTLDARWTYCCWNLALLKGLDLSINSALEAYNESIKLLENKTMSQNSAPPLSPDTLNVSQQKTLLTSVQFVVGLGILPNLQPGVGIALHRRSEFASLLQDSTTDNLNDTEKEWRLWYSMKSLVELVWQPSIGVLILSRNLGDILAAKLQLCCASTLKRKHKPEDTKQQDSHDSSTVGGLTRKLTPQDLEQCEQELKRLLEKLYPPALVRELLILQGGNVSAQQGDKFTLQKSPAWLRRACGRLLSDVLMKPRGVQYVLRGMLASPGDEGNIPSDIDWKKCEAVGKIVAHCPRQSLCVDEYYKAIGPQVLQLLHEKEPQLQKQFLQVAVSTVSAMLTLHNSTAKKYILQPLMSTLYLCIQHEDEGLSDPQVIVKEQQLEMCVEDAYKVFVIGMEPHSMLLMCLQEVIHVLFKLYCVLYKGVSHLKSKVEELLVCFLNQCDHSLQVLQAFAFEEAAPIRHFPFMCSALQFVPGDSGGIKVMECVPKSSDWEDRVTCVVEMLAKLNRDQISADFFIHLLKELTFVISHEITLKETEKEKVMSQLLENPQERIMTSLILLSLLASMCEKLGHTCFKSTAHILEFVQATLQRCVNVLQNTEDEELGIFETETVTMAMGLLTAVMSGASKVTKEDRLKSKELLPLLQVLGDSHPDPTVKEMASDLRIAIATHGFVLSEALKKPPEFSKSDHKVSSKKGEDKNSTDRKGTNLKIENLEKGIGVTENNVHKSSENDDKGVAQKKPLIEVLSSTYFDEENVSKKQINSVKDNDLQEDSMRGNVTKDSWKDSSFKELSNLMSATSLNDDKTNDSLNGAKNESKEIKGHETRTSLEYRQNYKPGETLPSSTSSLHQAFEELLDPLIPVRGHALISLKRLLEQKDKETLEKQDILVDIFRENLEHNDTYIYLAAIQGLAVLANMVPEKVFAILAKEYTNFNQPYVSEDSKSTNQGRKRTPELRMKIGEVMMKSVRNLGDIAPRYRDAIMPALLAGCRDPDHLVRASAMSNLGELCKLLHFSLGSIIYEVLECVSSLVKTDPEVQVRRSAAMFITMLLQGLGENTLKILDSALSDLYKLLKHLLAVEKDDTVLQHVHTALAELDAFMSDFLFPKQTLRKKISVLDPPNSG